MLEIRIVILKKSVCLLIKIFFMRNRLLSDVFLM